ncbi:MAG: lipopolysaccharide biosynthesis protein [Patescibacteria group bacterium]
MLTRFKHLWSDKFVRGTFILTVGTFLASAFNYLVHPILSRYLSVGAYGDFQALLSFIAILGILTAVVKTALTRETALLTDSPEELSRLHRRAAGRLSLLGLVLVILILIFSRSLSVLLNISLPEILPIAALCFIYVFPLTVNRAILTGLQAFAPLAWLGLYESAFRLVLAAVLVAGLAGGLLGAAWSLAGTSLLAFVISFYYIRRAFTALGRRKADDSLGEKTVAGQSIAADQNTSVLPFGAPGLEGVQADTQAGVQADSRIDVRVNDSAEIKNKISRTGVWTPYALLVLWFTGLSQFFYNFDMLFVKASFTPEEAGFYGSLLTVGRIIYFVGGAVPTVMFPVLAGLKDDRTRRRFKVLLKSLGLMALLTIPALLVIVFWPEFMIKIVVGGKYLSAAPYLPLFALAILLLTLMNVLAQYFLALARRRGLLIMTLGAIAEVLVLIFIPFDFRQVIISLVAVFGLVDLILLIKLFQERQGAGAGEKNINGSGIIKEEIIKEEIVSEVIKSEVVKKETL